MRKTTILMAVLCLTLTAGAASAATYAVPCFEWDCHAGDGNCSFDATCSGFGGVWAWSWNFGDGTFASWVTHPTISHYYPVGDSNADVTLTLTLFSVGDVSETCSITYRNVIGPPDDLVAECPDWDACNCP